MLIKRVQDVTEIIGSGKVDLGFKAMIHTLAVSLRMRSRAQSVQALFANMTAGESARLPSAVDWQPPG
jgi:hypothetical protein